MKTAIVVAALMLAAGVCTAQIVNADFEQWTGNDPDGWFNLNWFHPTVEPSDNAQSGSHSARFMVDLELDVMWIEQDFAISDVQPEVTLEVHYFGLTPDCISNVIILASSTGGFPEGNTLEITDNANEWRSTTLTWEPMSEDYDTMTVWIDLGPVDDSVAGQVLVDNVILRGVTGLKVGERAGVGPISDWRLDGIYPNPFNSRTTVRFIAPSASPVDLGVYDLAGRRIATVANGIFSPGEHIVPWLAPEGLGAGAYIIRLEAAERKLSTRAVFIK